MRDELPRDERADERAAMVRAVAEETRETESFLGKSELDPRVMEAIGRVPRHEFVPDAEQAVAYANTALPIARGQTISQPYVVAVMTDLANVDEGSVVLEVGTGCGYQAAVLAELADRVYSIERIPELAESAAKRLHGLGYDNVEVRAGDGYYGWPERAPFDAVVVTAGAQDVPAPLVEQVRPGGRLVAPVSGGPFGQELVVVEKDTGGRLHRRSVLPVLFVPLVHEDEGE